MTELAHRVDPPAPPDRAPRTGTPRLVGAVWALLTVNVLGLTPVMGALLPIPRLLGQMITMGCLALAFGLALLLNAGVRIRPNGFLLLLSLLALAAVMTSLRLESGTGSLLRTARLAMFVATLWLLCRWWRGDLRFLRVHLRAISVVLLSILVGLMIHPSGAFNAEGRLEGIVWSIPATQVGQWGAVATGLAAVMWLAHELRGRDALMIVVPGFAILILSHTRTALLGLVVGVLVATLILLRTAPRARRFGATVLLVAGLLAVAPKEALLTWLKRGQDAEGLANLTGRQKVWDALLAAPRTDVQHLFGVGLTDKSFGGLAIDSSWLSVYHELGMVGVCIVAAMLLVLLVRAILQPRPKVRAFAVFLVLYCSIASYTEVGLGDASPYLLHLAVVASLLSTPSRAGATPAGDTREETVL